jgi:hypothetical protein
MHDWRFFNDSPLCASNRVGERGCPPKAAQPLAETDSEFIPPTAGPTRTLPSRLPPRHLFGGLPLGFGETERISAKGGCATSAEDDIIHRFLC